MTVYSVADRNTDKMAKLTFEEFVALAEANAHNDHWLFGEGWEMVHQYPEYSDRYILESLAETFRKKETQE